MSYEYVAPVASRLNGARTEAPTMLIAVTGVFGAAWTGPAHQCPGLALSVIDYLAGGQG